MVILFFSIFYLFIDTFLGVIVTVLDIVAPKHKQLKVLNISELVSLAFTDITALIIDKFKIFFLFVMLITPQVKAEKDEENITEHLCEGLELS
jgi:hypothetical protein